MDPISNPTLYVTIGGVAVVYVLVAIWARRKDRKDIEKVYITCIKCKIYRGIP